MFRVRGRAGITLNVVLMIVTTKGIFNLFGLSYRSTLAIGGEDARKKVYMGYPPHVKRRCPHFLLARGL